jgi:DNA-binding CsgD family transcriptional regulator
VAWGHCEDTPRLRPLAALRDVARELDGALLALIDGGSALGVLYEAVAAQLNPCTGCTVLVIDDLQTADAATLDFVAYLSRRISARPVVLVLSHRNDVGGPCSDLRRLLGGLPAGEVLRIALQPLSPPAVTELAVRHGHAPSGLYAASGGIPHYLTALLEAGPTMAVDTSAALSLPPALRDTLRHHLEGLETAQRELLDTLCVFDSPVEWWLAQTLLTPAALAAVDDAVAQGWLVLRSGMLSFRIGLRRLATLDALPPMQGLRRHAAALAALSHPPPGVATPPAARLLAHAAQAGDAAQVLRLAVLAARESARAGAHREAAQQLALALRFESCATLEQRAWLWERWSAEAALSAVDERVIKARRHAVDLWRQLGRREAVARNLRALAGLQVLPCDDVVSALPADVPAPGRRRGPYARAREHRYGLTGREQQMLALLVDGLANGDIALQLGLALRTVEHHVSAVLAKLGVIDRRSAAELACREGLVGGVVKPPSTWGPRVRTGAKSDGSTHEMATPKS